MTEETLQSESEPVENFQVDEPAQSDPIQEPALAPEAEQTASESETNQADVNQEKINQVINKKHFEKMEAERRAAAAEARLQEIEEKQRLEEQNLVNNIPAMPDVYDDDYDQKLAERDEAIHRKAAFDAQQNILAQQQQQLQQRTAYEQQQKIAEREKEFLTTAKKQGVNQDEMTSLLGTIGSYGGVGSDNAAALMSDPDAALIIKHLAANPQEIAAIRQMNGYSLANHVNQNIRAKAHALKPKQSAAPTPATNVSGNGADPESSRYRLIDGFSIE